MSTNLKAFIPKLANQTIVVIGDIILDEYIVGQATRMSREAPIPILEFESKRHIAGGAANPSANVVSLGSHAVQVGVIGDDDAGRQLTTVLTQSGIDVEGLITCQNRPTTVKTRIMAQMGLRFPQQVARVDTLSRQPISHETEEQIITFLHSLENIDAILLSHYHGGLLTKSLVKSIREICQSKAIMLTADAQGNFDKFMGIDVIKCNADDASTYLDRSLITHTDFEDASNHLRQALQLTHGMVITRGSDGATVSTPEGVIHCPAPAVSDVFDTVGAGDTAIAIITLGIAGGIVLQDAVMLANYASGIVVRHVGNYAPSPTELAQSIGDVL